MTLTLTLPWSKIYNFPAAEPQGGRYPTEARSSIDLAPEEANRRRSKPNRSLRTTQGPQAESLDSFRSKDPATLSEGREFRTSISIEQDLDIAQQGPSSFRSRLPVRKPSDFFRAAVDTDALPATRKGRRAEPSAAGPILAWLRQGNKVRGELSKGGLASENAVERILGTGLKKHEIQDPVEENPLKVVPDRPARGDRNGLGKEDTKSFHGQNGEVHPSERFSSTTIESGGGRGGNILTVQEKNIMEDRGSGAVVVGTIGLDPGSPNKTLKLPPSRATGVSPPPPAHTLPSRAALPSIPLVSVDDHPLPSTQFRAPVLPLPKGVVFSFIGTHNIQHIRDLHSVIFPVRYNDQFFRDLCFVHLKELSRIAFFNHTPIGAICCRREPLLPPKSSGLSRAAPTTVPLPLATQHPKSSGLKQIPPVPSPSDPSRIYIMTLGVLAPYRRLHVGSHLLDHIIQFAQETPHIYQLCLHVQTTNTAALAFYERKGFEKRQLLSGYYARNKGVEPPDAWFLVRIIRLGG